MKRPKDTKPSSPFALTGRRPGETLPAKSRLKSAGTATTKGAPGRSASSDVLPPIRLPSRFQPAMFRKASAGRGARPEILKDVDQKLDDLTEVNDPVVKFERLRELQASLDRFITRYRTENSRKQAAAALKRWVDGAVNLRAPLYEALKNNGNIKR